MESNKKKILFIYPNKSTFVQNDLEILSEKFEVEEFHYVHKKSYLHHFAFQIKILFWLLRNFGNSCGVYIWFADYHSLLPILFAKFFSKKSFLVLGGYDVAYIPELNYGSFNNPIRSFCAKQSIKNATINFAVSKYVLNKAKEIEPKANVKLIYNGVSFLNSSEDVSEKEDKILTVGVIDSERRIKLKGIDSFVKVAEAMPEYQFTIIGITGKMQNRLGKIPKNLQMIDQIPHNELLNYYKSAKVYCQFSIVESFGLALAEAMFYGAIPVVMNSGALPEIVGDCGYVLENQNIGKMKGLIEKGINAETEQRKTTQERIMTTFSLQSRKEKILELINC